ncbi:hypothetical protein OIDMADRAFT_153369 [Oidiodendron maius Zn]|uniref:Methyltransferase domain-containing protein n=1 Tax=Oidiodendron maius (strain Zn) TaxID=913774 RepID=A0A0C3E360_OIDMZ|nr:hypothetical protein OIDMADRAFT_153369 [Oidiodendron maius Zn]
MGSRDKRVGWYTATLDNVSDVQRDLLEHYSKIPAERVIPHILEIRDRAWEIHPYPCVGELRFIDLSLCRMPSYSVVLERLKAGGSLLDIGCCFAQDIRKLVHDGAPADHLWGAELLPDFIKLGYELFRDRETLSAHFLTADIFDVDGPLKQLTNSLDAIHIGLFLHLFDWNGQKKACETIVGLLKNEPGVLVLGQQVGSLMPGQVPKGSGSNMYKHDATTFEKMWKEVGEATGTEWEVRASLDTGLGIEKHKRKWDDPSTRRLTFEVKRLK